MASLALARLEPLDRETFDRQHESSLYSKSCPTLDKAIVTRPTSASSITYQIKQRSRLNSALRASEGQLLASPSHSFGGKPKLASDTRSMHRPRSRPSTAGSSAVWSLSHETQVQNNKAQKVEARLHEYSEAAVAERAAKCASTPKAKTSEAAPLINPHFEEDIKVFEGELHEMWGRIRLEGLIDEKSAKLNKEEERERAEEKKQREEAQRRLRQAAKEAQNPKKRVLLRMEEQRQNIVAGEAETIGISSKVPMKNYEAASGSDGSAVPLVDVHMLQAKAIGLNTGSKTFSGIYGIACDHDKRRAWEAEVHGSAEMRPNHVKLNSMPGGSSVMSRSKSLMHSRTSQKAVKNDQRQLAARLKKRDLHEKRTIHLMASMRSGIDMDEGMCCNHDTLNALKDISYQVAQAALKGNFEGLTGPLRRRAQSRMSIATTLSRHSVQSMKKPKAFWWGVLRGVFWMLGIFTTRRRQWAAERVRIFCLRLTYHDKIKRAVRMWNVRVRHLAAIVRAFLLRKNKWYEKVSRDFERIEDAYLSAEYIKQPFGELQPTIDRSMTPAQAAKLQQDPRWRALKIPVKHRKFALGRWYFLQLRKKVASQTGWTLTIGDGMTQKTDLQRFFQLCGLEMDHEEADYPSQKFHSSSTAHSVRAKGNQSHQGGQSLQRQNHDMLEMKEQDLMEMLTSLAHSVKDVAPFQLHPCNTQPQQKLRLRRKMSRFYSNHDMGDTAESRTHSESDLSIKVKEGCEEQSDVDLEELFRTFTPRLHEIREAQMVTGLDEGDEASLSLVRESDL